MFPRIPVKILLASGRQKAAGIRRQWDSKLNYSSYLSFFGKCRPFGSVFLGFPPKFPFTQGNKTWVRTLQRKLSHFLLLFFWVRTGWNQESPWTSWWTGKLQNEVQYFQRTKTARGKSYLRKASTRSSTSIYNQPHNRNSSKTCLPLFLILVSSIGAISNIVCNQLAREMVHSSRLNSSLHLFQYETTPRVLLRLHFSQCIMEIQRTS